MILFFLSKENITTLLSTYLFLLDVCICTFYAIFSILTNEASFSAHYKLLVICFGDETTNEPYIVL